jgi:hypothetical protein
MKEIALQYANMLFVMFQYDISILSQKWLIFTVVPAVFYLVFFFIKWVVLTTPLWLPLTIIFSAGRSICKK